MPGNVPKWINWNNHHRHSRRILLLMPTTTMRTIRMIAGASSSWYHFSSHIKLGNGWCTTWSRTSTRFHLRVLSSRLQQAYWDTQMSRVLYGHKHDDSNVSTVATASERTTTTTTTRPNACAFGFGIFPSRHNGVEMTANLRY